MLKKYSLIFLILASCKTAQVSEVKSPDNRVLFTVSNTPISVEEFKYVYSKNNINNDSANTKDDIKDYLDLFVNFKLKIEEAKSRNMHETEAFQKELDSYLEQLKKPYLSENQVTDRLVKEAYERYNMEVRASHLLINIIEEDTLSAYNKAIELRNQILNGASFEKVAKENSSDPSVRINGGDLGYFSSFQMVYPFESAAYSTKVGEVSMPVKTKFGYHLINVKDKRPTNGKVQVAHIMLRHKGDSSEVRNKIFEIHDQVVGGVEWDELVKQNSEDINSRNTNGILRPFSVGQMPFPFQEAAFALKNKEELSDPVKTKYGWHIIKLIKREPIESFDKLKPTIESRIAKDVRSEMNEKVLMSRLKKENGFSENKEAFEALAAQVDSSLIKGEWNPSIGSTGEKTLITIGNRKKTIQDFLAYVKTAQKPSSYSPEKYLNTIYSKYKKEEIISYEEDHLEEKYVDYKMLVNEYREGILLFELMEKEVWNRAVEDTVGLGMFFESNRSNYQWNERAKASIFSTENDAILERIIKAINNSDSSFLTKSNLYKEYNSGSSLNLEMEAGTFEKGSVGVLDEAPWEVGTHRVTFAGKKHLVWISAIEKPRPKELNEAKGAAISDYQNALEKEWLEELKAKYEVKIDDNILNQVYEELAD